jgi:YD repeat-containing protein
LQSLLGQPIQEGWPTFGEIRAVDGSDFAEWTSSLKGSKGRGQLHGVANRIGDTWHYSRLLFISADGKNALDLTPSPAPDKFPFDADRKKVFLVPLGDVQGAGLDWAHGYYRSKFGLDVEVLHAIPLDASGQDFNRHQFIAERLIATLERSEQEEAKDRSAVFIGVTREDMYIESYDWRYAINYRGRGGRFAVVSTARLSPRMFFQKWNRALETSRLQKMITKNMYLLCFDLPLSGDSTSALSGGVMSPEEIDSMSDQVIGAATRWQSVVSGGEPTISVTFAQGQPAEWKMEAETKPPADVSSEYFGADLKIGLFIQRKTDFYLDGDWPLQFVRVYRNKDADSYGFGIGANDSLDTFIDGEPGKVLELALEDGARIPFHRDQSKENADKQIYLGRSVSDSPFSHSRILLEGYSSRLVTSDGWQYLFPYREKAQAESKYAVLTGYGDSRGHRFQMERNEAGDLLRITTPEGKWLHFESDEKHRFRRIEASDGRAVNYEYDETGRLIRVSDSQGNVESYRYDEKNQMRAVLDGQGNVLMDISYSPDGWVTNQRLRDGRSFNYEYRWDTQSALTQNKFTDPQGFVTLFNYRGGDLTQSLRALPSEEGKNSATEQ